jgi:hypothetical protein
MIYLVVVSISEAAAKLVRRCGRTRFRAELEGR